MNKNLIIGGAVYAGFLYGVFAGFGLAEKEFTKVAGIQAVAVEKKKGRAPDAAIDKRSYMLRKLTPGDGEAAEGDAESLSLLSFDMRKKSKEAAGPYAKLFKLIDEASKGSARASIDEEVAENVPPPAPQDLKLLRVSVVMNSGAVINGRYRAIGEHFTAGSTQARILAANASEGKVELADAGGGRLWIAAGRGPE